MGLSFYGDPFEFHAGWDEENHIGRLWKRYMEYLSGHPDVFNNLGKPDGMYELCVYNEESREKGLLEIFVGMACSPQDVANIPVDLLVKVLPDTQYAIFTFSGEEISSDWEKVLQDWLATSGYQSTASYNFQYYDERFKGMDRLAESVLEVYVPIKKAG